MASEPESSQSRFLTDLLETVTEFPGSSARELARHLSVTRREVNRVLYSRPDLFTRLGDLPPRWFAGDVTADDQELAEVDAVPVSENLYGERPDGLRALRDEPTPHQFDESQLYPWQAEALSAWETDGRRGIVEAVTGAGKTMVAIAAAARVLSEGGSVVIVVPKIDLQRQWRIEVERHLPGIVIGELGGSNRPPRTLVDADLLIAVVNSGSRWEYGLIRGPGLLIADECHRNAAESFSLSLEEGFEARLGLSATVERADGLDEEVLLPYFGGISYTLDFAAARMHDVIAPVRVAHIGVSFTPDEQLEHDDLSNEIGEVWYQLVHKWGVPASPVEDHFREVNRLHREMWSWPEGKAAGRYLKAITMRRRLIADVPAKAEALSALVPAIRAADRVLIFVNSISAAGAAALRLRGEGVEAAAFHSQVDRVDRTRLLGDFREGRVHVLAAPQVLDEGIDVPAADLGIILGASSSKRQMIQRMGRILRKKPDGRMARFALVYVRGTAEDPECGAHEAFLGDLQGIAEAEQRFDLDSAAIPLLNDFMMPRAGH